ncbi:MAG TPA: hypothetical protein VKS21_01535 [Spirochaetota bacterium]|nr:hypothetical protein [Spirochaetota bacterium]
MKRVYPSYTNLQGFKLVKVNAKVMSNFEQKLLTIDKKVIDYDLSYTGEHFALIIKEGKDSRLFYCNPGEVELFEFSRFEGCRDSSPAMTKNGNEIFFASDRFRNYEIFRANVADFNQDPKYFIQYELHNMSDNLNPAVDYNGRILAYESTKRERKNQIYVLNRKTGEELLVSDPLFYCKRPRVAGDGSSVVYEAVDKGNFEIYTADLQNKFMINISDNSARDIHPDIDETANRIVFQSDRNNDIYDIYMFDFQLKKMFNLTHNIKSKDNLPSISADGQIVAFAANEKFINDCIKVIDFNLKIIFIFWDNDYIRNRPQLAKDGNSLVYYRNGELYKVDLVKTRQQYGSGELPTERQDVFQINNVRE